MARISVPLREEEKEALWRLAVRERRDARDQAGLIIVRELQRTGLLPPEPQPIPAPEKDGGDA